MKQFLIITIFLFSTLEMTQVLAQSDDLNYCGKKITVPEGCESDSAYELHCNGISIQWMYLEQDMLTFMPEQYLDQLDERLKKFKKKEIRLVSLGQDIEGYLVSYKEDKVNKYKIVAFGNVNEDAVLLNLSIPEEPVSNEDLPEFIKQIIAFKE